MQAQGPSTASHVHTSLSHVRFKTRVIEGPSTAPNGARIIARYLDGSVFEYIENGRRSTADRGA